MIWGPEKKTGKYIFRFRNDSDRSTLKQTYMIDERISVRSGEAGFIDRFKKGRSCLISFVNSA